MARKREVWKLVNLAAAHADRILLYGPPGTGKTTAAVRAGDRPQVIKVTLHEETPAAELQGFFVPNGDKFVWNDGLAVKAWNEGCLLVIDEIDRASGDALTMLYAILDDPSVAKLTLPNGETVHPKPGFKAIATMNGSPDELPAALRDRFEVAIEVSEVHPEAVNALDEDLRKVMANIHVGNQERSASIRSWKSFGRLRNEMGEEAAAQCVFGDTAEEVLDSLRVARA